MSKERDRTGPLWLWVVVGFGILTLGSVFVNTPPIPQDLTYHYFASDLDENSYWNLLTNLPFLLVGGMGLSLCLGTNPPRARASWIVLFAGVMMVAFGSTWYHWTPNNETLVWDRLPMAIGFMGLFVAMLHDFSG